MKKSKRWEIEDRYSRPRKFDRAYANSYEGNRMPMHCLRDRRNWKGSKVWIHSKYLEGLLLKYINKPIEVLEAAYNRRVKEIPNAESFKDAYDYIIESLNERKWRFPFKYIVEDGILKKNPEYKSRHYYRRNQLKDWQLKYNFKHIINPGEVRTIPVSHCYFRKNSGMKTNKPIYIGKLYVSVYNKTFHANVYHFFPDFLDRRDLERDAKLVAKKERFENEWVKVNIGILRLDYYKEERNSRYDELKKLLENSNLTEIQLEQVKKEFKWTNPIIKNNYGLGGYFYPVCKIKELETTWQGE